MFKSLHRRARTVAATGVIAALAVAGVAFAQGGHGGSKGNGHRVPRSGKRMPPPPGGPLGKLGKDLTYAQLHVQHNGEAEVVRLDRGSVVAVDESSITLKENDGNEVTISVDEETKVLARPGSKTTVSDLQAGQEVLVAGPEGSAAKAIIVPPPRGQRPHGNRQHGEMPPPPPGAPSGGPQGAPSEGSQ